MLRPSLLAVLVVALAAACVTEKTTEPPVRPIPVEELGRWRVVLGGRDVGVLRQVRLQLPEQPAPFYLVEHPSGARAGMIDHQGRAYRDEIFGDRRVLVGMGSMAEDLRLLLELPERPAIEPWHDDGPEKPEATPR